MLIIRVAVGIYRGTGLVCRVALSFYFLAGVVGTGLPEPGTGLLSMCDAK